VSSRLLKFQAESLHQPFGDLGIMRYRQGFRTHQPNINSHRLFVGVQVEVHGLTPMIPNLVVTST
jgi:hypothetical protein